MTTAVGQVESHRWDGLGTSPEGIQTPGCMAAGRDNSCPVTTLNTLEEEAGYNSLQCSRTCVCMCISV